MATNIPSVEAFEATMKSLEGLGVLYFYAPWASPCQQMTVIIDELARQYTDVMFAKVTATFLFISD